VGSLYQILIRQKRNNLYAIAILNKNPVNRTVPFENELVPYYEHFKFSLNMAAAGITGSSQGR